MEPIIMCDQTFTTITIIWVWKPGKLLLWQRCLWGRWLGHKICRVNGQTLQ